jgi:hypothetical protein
MQEYSAAQVAEKYQYNKSYVKAEILRGKLKARKVGNQYVIKATDAQAWFDSLKRRHNVTP